MKVVIVAKTRMGQNTCVGAAVYDTGQSVRLIPRANPKYHGWPSFVLKIGDIVDVVGRNARQSELEPPHVEDFLCAEPVPTGRKIMNLTEWIGENCEVVDSGVDDLFYGCLSRKPSGKCCLVEGNDLPEASVQYWRIPFALEADLGRNVSYFALPPHRFEVIFKGLDDPVSNLPSGSLVRVSLARFHKFDDEPALEPRKCWLQLSGWYD